MKRPCAFSIFFPAGQKMVSLLLLFLLGAAYLRAQSGNFPPPSVDRPVKDSAGKWYTLQQWIDSMGTGRYVVRYEKNGVGMLVPITPEQRRLMREALPMPKQSPFFRTGAKFKPFNEKDMQGNRLSLKELAGKVVVINFWFVDCQPCRKEIPELNELVALYKNNPDVVFIAWALDKPGAIREFLEKVPFDYRIVDNARLIAYDNRVQTYPTNLVLNRQGKILFHTTGYSPAVVHWLEKSIEYALQDKTYRD